LSNTERIVGSNYMRWAKQHANVKYNLANSGLTNYQLIHLPVMLNDIELSGNNYYGYPPLIQAIADRYSIGTDTIFTTLGTSFANFMVMSVLFEPGADILIEQPTYELLISTAHYIGYNVNRFHRRFENKFQIDPDEIKKLITSKTKLIVLTNLHNPSSVLTDDLTLKESGNIARQNNAYVFVDEVYLDAAFDLSPRSSIHLGEEFIISNSLTKVYGLSGIRCGWVLGKPDLIKKMWHLGDLFYVNHVYSAQQLGTIAFANLETISGWARNILDHNHNIFNRFNQIKTYLEIVYPGFGTVIYPRLKNGKVEELYRLLLDKFDTVITPGRFFEMPDHFRIGLGCPADQFEIGLQNLGKALDILK